jgi:hypothetical protein
MEYLLWNVDSWSATSRNAFNTHLFLGFICSWNDTFMKFKRERERERERALLATYPD